MLQRLVFAAALASALILPAAAQDDPGGAKPPAGEGDEERPRRERRRAPARKLEFDAAPAEWKAHEAPQGGRGAARFQGEWQLPAAAGQSEGPVVTVMASGGQRREFDGYRTRIRNGWTKDDGSPLGEADQKVETRKEGELEVRLVEQAGTRTAQKGAEPKKGQKLIAAWVKAGNDGWSVWLLGTTEGVEAAREAFLKWLDTARPGAAPAAPPAEEPKEEPKPEEPKEEPKPEDGPH